LGRPRIVGGEYVAYLEDGPKENALALDAEHKGNEARFINSYVGVAERPCLVMKTAYVNGLPIIMLIATKKIEVSGLFSFILHTLALTWFPRFFLLFCSLSILGR
jgi:hypothetical protein